MATTGFLLAYERQVLDWANAGLRSAPPAETARLPFGKLLNQAQEAQGGTVPTGVTWRSDTSAPIAVSFGRELTVYVNPYTGAVLGEGAKGLRKFFQTV